VGGLPTQHQFFLASDGAINSIDQHLMAQQLCFAFMFLPESFRHSDRAFIVWMDEANDVLPVEFVETICECTAGAFTCQAFTPVRTSQCPANFKSGPAFGIKKTDAPNELATYLFFHRPVAITAQLPMAHQECEMPPGFQPVESLTPEITHHFLIRAHFRIGVEVFITPHAEQQSISF